MIYIERINNDLESYISNTIKYYEQTGSNTVSIDGDSYANKTIYFPYEFISTPVITITLITTNGEISYTVSSISTTKAVIKFTNSKSTSYSCQFEWLAPCPYSLS